jgi:single-stranded-DNA-specific exonuclease
MTTFDEEQALEIAKYIDQQNNERKDIVTTIAKEALDLIDPNAPVHILAAFSGRTRFIYC